VIPFVDVLIKMVSKIFPDKKHDMQDANSNYYLSDSSVDFPDTALISLIKEMHHLYNNTIEIILDSLHLTPEDIHGDISHETLCKKIKIADVETIDALYNQKFKKLYGEIVDFSSLAQSNNSQKYYDNFYAIKMSALGLAEIIKSLKHLQKNLVKYSSSSNEYIKQQYCSTMTDIIKLILSLEEIESESKIDKKIYLLTRSKHKIKQNDALSNGSIDAMIRKNQITNEMATSLMNDSYYKNEITSKLLSISELIYNNDISDELTQVKKKKKIQYWFEDPFGLSEKKLDKAIAKLSIRKNNLKQKLKKQKDKSAIQDIQEEILIINTCLENYKR